MKTIKFRKCPVCRTRSVIVQMPDDWQAQVDAGAAIPIVGCGNPWHYRFSEAEARAPLEAEIARLREIEEAVKRMAASGATGDQDEEETDFWFAASDAIAALEGGPE